MMGARIDMTGRRFGRIRVLEYAGTDMVTGRCMWRCVCDCGTEFLADGSNLRYGRTRSCGCLRSENAARQGRANAHPEAIRVAILKEGRRLPFPSCNQAARFLGVPVKRFIRAARTGSPVSGWSIETLNTFNTTHL